MAESQTLTRQPIHIIEAETPTVEFEKVKETAPSNTIPNPSELVPLGRPPEICNLLEIGEAYKHFNMEAYTNEVDSFINGQIESQGLKDTKDSYKKVFESVLQKSRAPRGDIYSLVERMREYVVLQNKLINIAKEKSEFEKKPIDEMDSKQLKRRMKEEGILVI